MEKKLKSLLRQPVKLTITDNRRSIISAKRVDGAYYIRLHHMFLEADDEVIESLAKYISKRSKIATKKIDIFIRKNEDKIRKSIAPVINRTIRLRVKGRYFNLGEVYEKLNRKYFNNRLNCKITWGNRRSLKRQKSIRLGSYSYQMETIRIHPTLDRSFVPDYVLNNVVYHEMLHAFLGVKTENGRNYSHHQRFRELEKKHAHKKLAEEWIGRNLNRLLAALPKPG